MGVWETTRGELATATDRDFERKILVLGRIVWPNLVQPPSMKKLDSSGIDLVVWADDGPFPVVVQCKGFHIRGQLDHSQYYQIRDSIDAFRRSNFTCEQYIVVHNNNSKNKSIKERINNDLKKLLKQNKAKHALCWDRFEFINHLKTALANTIIKAIKNRSLDLLEKQQNLFRFGSIFVNSVPAGSSIIKIRRNIRPEVLGEKVENIEIRNIISVAKNYRWIIITGMSGIGKTTSMLHSLSHKKISIIYVKCEEIDTSKGDTGTHAIMQRIIETYDLLEEFDEQTLEAARRLSGTTLKQFLKDEHENFVLVFDGLDENRSFYTAKGIKNLTNNLAEINCPVLLTTRSEHFDSTFSNFEIGLEDLSIKYGSKRDGLRIDLKLWTRQQTLELIAKAFENSPDEKSRQAISQLTADYNSGSAQEYYGDLLEHPLFLQMILDTVGDSQITTMNRANLIAEWSRQKIIRDQLVGRPCFVEHTDIGAFAETIINTHKEISYEMTDDQQEEILLMETIPSNKVLDAVNNNFNIQNTDISLFLPSSFLTSAETRKKTTMNTKFMLRMFQEFFLAAYLFSNRMDARRYPAAVQKMCAELGA